MSYLDRHATSGMSSLFQALEGNTRRRVYVLIAAVGIVATIVLWVVHLTNPHIMSVVMEHDSKILMWFLFAVIIAPPFAVAFSIGSIISRRSGPPAHDTAGPMSGYFYREKANKEWKLLMIAGFVGGLNFVLMIITSAPVQ